MGLYRIEGGKKLFGEVHIGGAKNAILPILAACLLCEDEIVLKNCPKLLDVENTLSLMRRLGCKAQMSDNVIVVNCKGLHSSELPKEYSELMRSSIFMLGPLTARMKKAEAFFPGGCEIGLRPIDLHLKGLSKMNIDVCFEGGKVICKGEDAAGAEVVLDYPSVGATENILMAAVLTKGRTVIHNSAREPEIVDLQNFLNKMGARVFGAGTDNIVVDGVKKLHGTEYSIIGDRIVAGTFLAAGAVTGGEVAVLGAEPLHLQSVLNKLEELGFEISANGSVISVKPGERKSGIVSVETAPYPGFPTDMQAQFAVLCCTSCGTGVVNENVFENRFRYVSELKKMGADIVIKDRVAVFKGVEQLKGANVDAMDLRGGAALVLAGLCAQGITTVNNTRHIKRGYEDFVSKLNALGADITEEKRR